MSSLDVEDFINELKKGPERLVKISRMPEETRGEAIRGLGYGFTARELDDYICHHAKVLERDLMLGEGDFRDIIMKKWGNCLK